MIDIHCHPLPGVDDGAENLETSIAMCQMAAADGITHIVAAPHCNYKYEFRPEVNKERVTELQAAIGETPKILLGCDFHLSYDNIRHLIANRANFTINQSSYVLIELSEHFIPEQFDQVFYEIQVAGLTPILTHPERNSVIRRKPELVHHWQTRGCLVQVTAQSFTGGFGETALALTEGWLERNLIHFFATDAHDPKHRPPILSRCYQKVARARGKELADLLFRQNPEAVVAGKPLPAGPQPLELRTKKAKRSWRDFLRL